MAFTAKRNFPITPDQRYFVVAGILWRRSNPALSEGRRKELIADLMRARRAVRSAKRACDETAERQARATVDSAKIALGERGPPWWTDGAPDLNRHRVAGSIYADWFKTIEPLEAEPERTDRDRL